MNKHFFVLLGTRPEAIKLFPLINMLRAEDRIDVTICASAQHREILDQVLTLANIVPDIDLDVMTKGQTLDSLCGRLLFQIGDALDRFKPTRVIVQGDTSTAMVGALASYYRRIPVAHVEAGLRTGDIYAPWPEEVNRKIIGSVADLHFAPTEKAAKALRSENVPQNRIHVTGNTVVDALIMTRSIVEKNQEMASRWAGLKELHGNRRIILVTCHRRENFGSGIQNIVEALLTILDRGDVAIVLPVHPNPNVHDVLAERLGKHPRAQLISPQEYTDFVSLLSLAHIVLTDSGGVQEEAPTFGKPVLVLRDTTERPEGVEAGTALLVGSCRDTIVKEAFRLLDDEDHYQSMSRAHNPFGDGRASERIVKVLLDA
jgi:UDP-N-acetylglucosamine 2-epimerase (non-hydrolysing)